MFSYLLNPLTEPLARSDFSHLSFSDFSETFTLQITLLKVTLISHKRTFAIRISPLFSMMKTRRELIFAAPLLPGNCFYATTFLTYTLSFLVSNASSIFLVWLSVCGYLFFLSVFPLFISNFFPTLWYYLCYVKAAIFFFSKFSSPHNRSIFFPQFSSCFPLLTCPSPGTYTPTST